MKFFLNVSFSFYFILFYFTRSDPLQQNKRKMLPRHLFYFILFYIIADVQTVKINEISLNVK